MCYLVVLIGAHLLPREAGQVQALPEVVPGARVVVPLVRREQARVDPDLRSKYNSNVRNKHVYLSYDDPSAFYHIKTVLVVLVANWPHFKVMAAFEVPGTKKRVTDEFLARMNFPVPCRFWFPCNNYIRMKYLNEMIYIQTTFIIVVM